MSGEWISPVRLYRLADGTIVDEAGVTDRAELYVGAGGRIPHADAERLGLIARYAPAPKAQAAPPADKAQRGPTKDK